MPWLSMYLVDDDVPLLCRMLAEDPDVALVRAEGPGRWKAQRDVPTLRDGQYALWHVPSGPITLVSTDLAAKSKRVANPFAGWREIVKPFEKGVPWFGPGPLGIVYLTVRRKAGPPGRTFSPMTQRPWRAPADEVIGLSEISWIGNHYSILGRPAHESTVRWWKSLGGGWRRQRCAFPAAGRSAADLNRCTPSPRRWRQSNAGASAPTTRRPWQYPARHRLALNTGRQMKYFKVAQPAEA